VKLLLLWVVSNHFDCSYVFIRILVCCWLVYKNSLSNFIEKLQTRQFCPGFLQIFRKNNLFYERKNLPVEKTYFQLDVNEQSLFLGSIPMHAKIPGE